MYTTQGLSNNSSINDFMPYEVFVICHQGIMESQYIIKPKRLVAQVVCLKIHSCIACNKKGKEKKTNVSTHIYTLAWMGEIKEIYTHVMVS